MVEILCPHCEEEIALDDDASGEFVCPYCGGEFSWNVEDMNDEEESEFFLGLSGNRLAAVFAISGIIIGIFSLSLFFSGIGGNCPEEYREPVSFDGEEGYSCSSEYETNVGGMLASIFSACFVLFPLSAFLIWLSYFFWTPATVFSGKNDDDEDKQSLIESISNGVFNVGVTGTVASFGVVLLLLGSLGLYFGVSFFFDLLGSGGGDSLGSIGIVIVIPILLALLIFCAGLVFIGGKYILTVVIKNVVK